MQIAYGIWTGQGIKPRGKAAVSNLFLLATPALTMAPFSPHGLIFLLWLNSFIPIHWITSPAQVRWEMVPLLVYHCIPQLLCFYNRISGKGVRIHKKVTHSSPVLQNTSPLHA